MQCRFRSFTTRLFTTTLAMSAAGILCAQTTSLGTRSSPSHFNAPIMTNAQSTWSTYSRPEDYPGAVTLPLQFITLASGKKLAVLVSVPTDAWGKKIPGMFPVILTQSAYRIDLAEFMGIISPKANTLKIGGLDQFMVRRGYITVATDVLGSGMSDGEEQLLGANEQEVYGEVVNWITRQPWFNGNIGVAGTSYLGISALFTAEQQNPAVKAVFAEVPLGDAYRGVAGTGGLMNAVFLGTWLPLTQALSVTNAPAELIHPEYAWQIAAATQLHVADVRDWYLPTINAGLVGSTGYATDDGTFWSVRSPLEKARQILVPTFIIGANHDIFQRDEPLLYEQLKDHATTKLLIVSGAHAQATGNAGIDHNNDVSHGAPGSETLMLQWFDQYLKGMASGAESMPNVTQMIDGYGAPGTERYATATDWPHPLMTPRRLYLRENMSLSVSAPIRFEASHTIAEPPAPVVIPSASPDGRTLSAKITLKDASECSISDVQWTLGLAGVIAKPCQTDDSVVEAAQGALLFDTPPLDADLYINGPIEADVWMSSTTSQAALSVRVDDVDPATGIAKPLTNGLMSAAYRAVDVSRARFVNGVMIQPWHPFTAASELPLIPGVPVMVPVEIFPAAALIPSGHKLRIAISASNQAQGVWPLAKQYLVSGGVTTVYSDALHASSVVLPVVPKSALN